MTNRTIIITRSDYGRLKNWLNSEFSRAIGETDYLRDLSQELDRATIVDSDKVPADTITMNSVIRLRDLKTGEVETWTLVYPDEANIAKNNLSILAPIGTAILGYREGDEVRWRVPSGWGRFCAEEVLYQPEREGAMHL